MNAEKLWDLFITAEGIDEEETYMAWQFGNDPATADHLATLVLEGIKKGTASCLWHYDDADEPIPAEGDYSVILNSRNEAVCIVRNSHVEVVPYDQVTEVFAEIEGEGDKSLAYWRQVHEAYFMEECIKLDIEFSFDLPIVCESFEVVFKA